MKPITDDEIVKLVCVFLIALLLGVMLGALLDSKKWASQCVKHNVAEYDSKTGEWKWKPEFRLPDEEE